MPLPEDAFPDEVVPREIDAALAELHAARRRRLDWAMLVTAVVAGWTLLLPWAYGRRFGVQVWHLGIELHRMPAAVWAVGVLAAVVALALRRRRTGSVATVVSVVAALIFVVLAWRISVEDGLGTGPGRAFALVAGLLWVMAGLARLVAERDHREPPPTEPEIDDAIDRLRRNRDRFSSG